MRYTDEMVDSILQELEMRQDYLPEKKINSIYFGGGTPSVLTEVQLGRFFESFAKYFDWSADCEITLEGNPDDFTTEKVQFLANSPVNRLSIGVQSFHDKDLEYMNRAHDSQMADRAIKLSQDSGLENITIDLIYGSPTTSMEDWKENLRLANSYQIPHISSYCLTVEEGTALHHFVQKGKMPPPDDSKSLAQFEMMLDELEKRGYSHYEISNFAQPGYEAIHNSSYWSGMPYLGLGPSAHSYDGQGCRSWNIAHNTKYIKGISAANIVAEEENLSQKDRYNEYVLTNLRTLKGITRSRVEEDFEPYVSAFDESLEKHISLGNIENSENRYILTRRGKFIADNITSDFFIV